MDDNDGTVVGMLENNNGEGTTTNWLMRRLLPGNLRLEVLESIHPPPSVALLSWSYITRSLDKQRE
jgi:hypothetical protein